MTLEQWWTTKNVSSKYIKDWFYQHMRKHAGLFWDWDHVLTDNELEETEECYLEYCELISEAGDCG